MNFIGQLDHRVHFLLGFFPFCNQQLEIGVDGVLTPEEGINKVFFQWETGFYGFFTRPIFTMSFALNKYLNGRSECVRDVGVGNADELFYYPYLRTNVVE